MSLPSFSTDAPLIGREHELAEIRSLFDQVASGRGHTLFLRGEGGIGKTRLAQAAAEEALLRGWQMAAGRAYPVETGVPYAPLGDALLPLVRELDPATLTVLTRGAEAELATLVPGLRPRGDVPVAWDEHNPAEAKTRLFWSFTRFLSRLAERAPLLLVVENLQWADASSLELLHFTARQILQEPVALLCTYNDQERDRNPDLVLTERSLVSIGAARVQRMRPLSEHDTQALVRLAIGNAPTDTLVAALYERTRGNPFFLGEILKELSATDSVEAERMELPGSVRDAVLTRLTRLSATARAVAEQAAVLGTRVRHDVLRAIVSVPEEELLTALDELRHLPVLEENTQEAEIVYDFSHPMIQEVLYTELGLARARRLHATVAETLEALYGAEATEHAGELAYHFSQAHAERLAPRAFEYLLAAGSHALNRHANREAVQYLSTARDRAAAHGLEIAPETRRRLERDLARGYHRLGEYGEALKLWSRLAADAEDGGDPSLAAAIRRQMGLLRYWSGEPLEAREEYRRGIVLAEKADVPEVRTRLLLADATCLQELGHIEEAREAVEEALAVAEALEDPGLLARAHRALLLVFAWTGPFDRAREHGKRAIDLAERHGERSVACTAHWTLGMVEGLTGHADRAAYHIARSQRLAEELGSPVLRLWTAEMSIELASATGSWEQGAALAEETIALARSLGQGALLPRLLVWAGMIHLGRGDLERSRAHFDEAWTLAGCDGGDPVDVHAAMPAHTGRAALHLAKEEYAEARRVGEAGLAIADRSGYLIWSIHRLIPVVAEAYLWMDDLEGAERLGERLHAAAERFGHRLARGWADACDGVIAQLRGELDRAIPLLRRAVEELESIPMKLDGARLRHQLALVLAEAGEREEAVSELRAAHDVLVQLGAERELDKVREQLRILGSRPPARSAGGVEALTEREREIIALVIEGKSNKAIGKALDISPRTVGTHLSNIYQKVGVGSRNELAEIAATTRLLEQAGPPED